MSRMVLRGLSDRTALLILAVMWGVAVPAVHAEDAPETRDMPDTLPAGPEEANAARDDDPAPATEAAPEPESDSSGPRVGLRLEAQLLAALAFPFGGRESGGASGFAISYGAGWGEIPVMIGLDFMSVGRSNSTTSRPDVTDDVAGMPVTRTSSDRLLDFDLWLRVQPPRWPVRPYVEGIAGAKLVQTNWSISSQDEVTSNGSDHAWTSALGWGVGVDFMGLFDAVASFSLTLGMRRMHGGDVRLERPRSEAGASKREVATNETMFIAGLCGRYDFYVSE